MRNRAIVLSSLASLATLSTGYLAWAVPHAASATPGAETAVSDSGSNQAMVAQSNTTGSSQSSSTTSTAGSTSTASGGSTNWKDGSYLGSAIMTRYGMVQVTAVVSGGKLTDIIDTNVNATGGRLAAVPMLKAEALSAQSANIAIISGATFTSEGYIQSLQSALDQAL